MSNTEATADKQTRRQATQRARETRAEDRALWSTQTIPVDENWRIIRADELNWEVQYKGKFWGYYGTLPSAFEALPAKMLGEGVKRSIADVLDQLKTIRYKIEDALKSAACLLSSQTATDTPPTQNK